MSINEMHAKYGIALLQMEITMAVLGDLGRYVIEIEAEIGDAVVALNALQLLGRLVRGREDS